MWGDDCALCGGPVGGKPIMVEAEDGSLVGVCPACAMRFGSDFAESQDAGPAFVAQPVTDRRPSEAGPGTDASLGLEDAASLIARMAQAREQEAADLRTLSDLLGGLVADRSALQQEVAERDARIHSLDGEIQRLRERLRATEAALAPTGSVPVPGTPEIESEPAITGMTTAGEPEMQAPEIPVAAAMAEAPEVTGREETPEQSDARRLWEMAGLTGDDLRLVQRCFAESVHTEKMRAVRRSLGRPLVNLLPMAGDQPRVMITIAWEIVWYQFIVDLSPDIPEDRRVQAFAEGMELSELSPQFLDDNASLDQGGRVDASELELTLLANPPELITEIPPDRAAALDDATEEIWNKRGQPEFRWDD